MFAIAVPLHCPLHKTLVTEKLGAGFGKTITVAVFVTEHPAAFATVTEKEVVDVSAALMEEVVCPEFHEYKFPFVLALSVAILPLQIPEAGELIVTVGEATTATTTVSEFVH